jgi:hypothetical protein
MNSTAVWPNSLHRIDPNGPDASADLDPASPHSALELNYAGSPAALSDARAWAGLGDGSGLPPTLVVVCEKDGLRPSGEAFVAPLEGALRDLDWISDLLRRPTDLLADRRRRPSERPAH